MILNVSTLHLLMTIAVLFYYMQIETYQKDFFHLFLKD